MLGAAILLLSMQAAQIGDFIFSERREPINDALQISAILQIDGARLSIGCDSSRAQAFYVALETERFLAIAPSRVVEGMMPFDYRVDDNPAESALARYGTTVAMIDGPQARAFAQRLANGSRIYLRVLGASGHIDASFAAAAARNAITRVAQRCGDRRLLERLNRDPGP